jgi:transcriptional regulator with PAS, ATPase and Fis domain
MFNNDSTGIESASGKTGAFRRKDGRLPSLAKQWPGYVEWVLSETAGNQTAAAHALGIDRVSLWRKRKRYAAER